MLPAVHHFDTRPGWPGAQNTWPRERYDADWAGGYDAWGAKLPA